MVILGLLLVVLGGLAIACGLFATEIDGTKLQFLGQDIGPAALFLIGVGSAVAIWWGLWIFKSGSKRSWARRKEQKRLEDLSQKLDSVDANRRMDVDREESRAPPTLWGGARAAPLLPPPRPHPPPPPPGPARHGPRLRRGPLGPAP